MIEWIAFILGVFFQFISKVKKIDRDSVVIWAGFTIFFGIFILLKLVSLEKQIFSLFFVSSLFLVIIFRKELLNIINEEIFIVINILFIYAVLTFDAFKFIPLFEVRGKISGIDIPFEFRAFLILVSLIMLIAIIPKKKYSYFFEGLLYYWYSLISVILSFIAFGNYFVFSFPFFFINPEAVVIGAPFELFFIGGIYLHMFSLTFCMFMAIPFPGENRSLKKAIRDSKEMFHLFAESFSDNQISYFQYLLAIIISVALIYSNHIFNFVKPEMIIAYIIPVFSLAFFINKIFIKHRNLKIN
jgi:hypothetical protein